MKTFTGSEFEKLGNAAVVSPRKPKSLLSRLSFKKKDHLLALVLVLVLLLLLLLLLPITHNFCPFFLNQLTKTTIRTSIKKSRTKTRRKGSWSWRQMDTIIRWLRRRRWRREFLLSSSQRKRKLLNLGFVTPLSLLSPALLLLLLLF